MAKRDLGEGGERGRGEARGSKKDVEKYGPCGPEDAGGRDSSEEEALRQGVKTRRAGCAGG